ncbi:Serine/threonine-protein kinase pkn1 [Phycisphaerae bacterium RAS2]|nr:Serine/threonine-protein kinase pkn1 [Phycisphaerae bacterium RAS2]
MQERSTSRTDSRRTLSGLLIMACAAWFAPWAMGQNPSQTNKAVGVEDAPKFAPVREMGAGNAALFIGINAFTKDTHLAPLKFAVNDAIGTAHLFALELKLVAPKRTALALSGEPNGDAAKAQLATLKAAGARIGPAAKSDIFLSLQQVIASPANENDILIVGLSSHGFEEAGVPYVMPADGVKAFLADTAINLTSVEQALTRSKAGKRLLILDACREKPLAGGRGGDAPMAVAFKEALAKAAGQAVLASCDVGEVSFENAAVGHGVFTHYLLKALRGEAPTDDAGMIRIDQVIGYVAGNVERWSKQNGPQVQRPWFKGPQVAREIPLAMDTARVAAIAEAARQKSAMVQSRLEALRKLAIDDAITVAQHALGKSLFTASPDTLDAQDRERLEVFVDLIESKIPARRLQALLDAVETPEQRAARLERERMAAHVTATLGMLKAALEKKNRDEAFQLLGELTSLSPSHPSLDDWRKRVEGLGRPKELTLDLGGGVTMDLVLIPAGEFMMGSPEEEEGRNINEGPQHRVRFSKPFYMGKYEVTNAQYRRFKPDHDSGDYRGVSLNNDNQPVVDVSREDAKAFCDWLRRQSGREVRLPSESEWEYACRGGDGREFPWSGSWPPSAQSGNYADETIKSMFSDWTPVDGYRDGYAVSSPVGSFSANPYGLHDMGGNVWEWCEDWYHDDYTGAPTDGRAWTTGGKQTSPVFRGAAWSYEDGRNLRSACRSIGGPDFRSRSGGFRVATGASP